MRIEMTFGDGFTSAPPKIMCGTFLSVNGDLGDTAGKALAGPQKEGHAIPAPVVDLQAQSDEGLGLAIRRNVCLFTVTRRPHAADVTRTILPGHDPALHLFLTRGGHNGAKNLDLFVTHGIAAVASGGSIATTVRSCNRWLCTMSRSAPALS